MDKIIIDLGTGDGRFVYKNALKNPNNFHIGIDPSDKFNKYQKKVNRKKLTNVQFITGSIEIVPKNLPKADEVYINLPWGSLLKIVIQPNNFPDLLKPEGLLQIIFGYHKNLEPSEAKRLDLPEISENYIKTYIIPKFEKAGFSLREFCVLEKKDLKKVETTWAKKLSFGNNRPVFKLIFKKC